MDEEVEVAEEKLIGLFIAGGFGPVEDAGHGWCPHTDVGLGDLEVILFAVSTNYMDGIVRKLKGICTYMDDLKN